MFFDAINIVAFAGLGVRAFPIYIDAIEAGFGEEFGDFGYGPESPVVLERLFEFAAIFESEVDVEGAVVGDGVEAFLFPDVLEAVFPGYFLAVFFEGFLAAHHVKHEDAFIGEVGVGGFEIAEEFGSCFEYPV